MSMNFRCLLLGGILLWAVGGPTTANAANHDEPATGRQPVPAVNAAGKQAPEDVPNKTELSARQRRRVVTAAFYVLGGILFVGVLLIALTVLWGSRTRRVARKPLPEASPDDPLWYLRPDKKITASEVGPPEEAGEPDPEHDNGETT